MKIALVQFECKLGDVDANVTAMCDEIASAAGRGADLVVFPELSDTGYHMPTIARVATPAATAETRARLSSAAGRHGVNVIAGLSRAGGDGRIENTAAAFDRRGSILGEYSKIHLFCGQPDPEDSCFSPGTELVVVPIDGARVGLMICYDLRFPELARSLVLGGAEMLVVPAAWPSVRIAHWRLLAAARALENLAVVVAVNRAGTDDTTHTGGHSAAFGATGEALCGSDEMSRGICWCDVNLERTREARNAFSWLRDRRAGAYRL